MFKRIVPFAMLATACILWGSSFVIAKLALPEMSALDITFWRSAVAAILFLPILLGRRAQDVSRIDVRNFLVIGALTVPITYLLQFGSLHFITAATAAVLIGVEPMTIAIASALLLGTTLKLRIVFASVLAALGVYIVFVGKMGESRLIGNAMVLASTVVVALWVVLTKKAMSRFSPIVSTAYISVFGFIVFLVVVPWLEFNLQRYSFTTWSSVLALAATSSILGHLLWNAGLQRVEAGQAGVFLALEPIAGVGFAALILREPLTFYLLGGLVLVVLAMLVATWQTTVRVPVNPSSIA